MKRFIFTLIATYFLMSSNMTLCQDSTSQISNAKKLLDKVNILLYADIYFGYDLNDPYSGYRTPLVYNYNRHSEFNVNMALVNFNYTDEKVEANIGLNLGSFPNAYYVGADTLYRVLNQANIKYKFSKKFDLNTGMFAPHLGFESIMSYDNMTVSHSLASEGTPYYIAGLKAYYHFTDYLELGLVVANGWQNLQRLPGTNQFGYGIHVHYNVPEDIEISLSNYSFNDGPDSTEWTVYNEAFIQKHLGKRLHLLGGVSYAFVPNSETVTIATFISQYKLTEQWAIAGRIEYINDPSRSFYTASNPSEEIRVTGFSANLDYQPTDKFKFRVEGRLFSSSSDLYRDDKNFEPSIGNVAFINNAANILFTAQIKID